MPRNNPEVDALSRDLQSRVEACRQTHDDSLLQHISDTELVGVIAVVFEDELTSDARRAALARRVAGALHGWPDGEKIAKLKRWMAALEKAVAIAVEEAREEAQSRRRSRDGREMLLIVGIGLGVVLLGAITGLARAEILPMPVGIGAFVVFLMIYGVILWYTG